MNSNWVAVLTAGSFDRCTNYLIKDCVKHKFLQPQDVPKVCIFGLTLTSTLPPEDGQNQKSKYFPGKNFSIRLSKSVKIKALSALNFQWKMQLLFALFRFFFWYK